MSKEVLYLGLDVHAENIAVAIAETGRDGEVRAHGMISSNLQCVEKLLRKLGHPHKELRVCYEAGPCGFVLARRLKKWGIACDVVAPSLTPKGSGDKIKTDRRDARMLARLHRAGELTAVHVPDERDEAIRDLCRARTDAVNDLRSGAHRAAGGAYAGLARRLAHAARRARPHGVARLSNRLRHDHRQ